MASIAASNIVFIGAVLIALFSKQFIAVDFVEIDICGQLVIV